MGRVPGGALWATQPETQRPVTGVEGICVEVSVTFN